MAEEEASLLQHFKQNVEKLRCKEQVAQLQAKAAKKVQEHWK